MSRPKHLTRDFYRPISQSSDRCVCGAASATNNRVAQRQLAADRHRTVRTQKAKQSKTVILTKSELPNITLGGGGGTIVRRTADALATAPENETKQAKENHACA